MITKNTYYKGEIFIAHAKPTITDSVTGVSADLTDFIDEYEREVLVKSLGNQLAYEFMDELDDSRPDGLKAGADAKWDKLLNGEDYTDINDEDKTWRGIRFKNILGGDTYDRSFLAYYVYFFFERDFDITRSNIGNQQEEATNAVRVSATQKTVNAWNKFVKLVQGGKATPTIIYKSYGIGVDHYHSGGEEINLYQYIQDKNALVEDTYADFNPKTWMTMNQFGI